MSLFYILHLTPAPVNFFFTPSRVLWQCKLLLVEMCHKKVILKLKIDVFGDHAKMEAGTIFFLPTVVKEEQLEEAVTESPLSC